MLALFFARYWQRQNKTCISYLLHGKFIGLLMPKQRELFKSIEIVAWIRSTLFHRQSSDEIHFNWTYLCIAIESWFCIEKPMHVTKQWNWHYELLWVCFAFMLPVLFLIAINITHQTGSFDFISSFFFILFQWNCGVSCFIFLSAEESLVSNFTVIYRKYRKSVIRTLR